MEQNLRDGQLGGGASDPHPRPPTPTPWLRACTDPRVYSKQLDYSCYSRSERHLYLFIYIIYPVYIVYHNIYHIYMYIIYRPSRSPPPPPREKGPQLWIFCKISGPLTQWLTKKVHNFGYFVKYLEVQTTSFRKRSKILYFFFKKLNL